MFNNLSYLYNLFKWGIETFLKPKPKNLNKHCFKEEINFKIFIPKIILLILFLYYIIVIILQKKPLLIEVDISKSFYEGGGPVQLQKGIRKVLPYKTKKCSFIPVNGIYPTKEKKDVNYFFLSFPCMREYIFDKWKFYKRANSLLLGPCFVPNYWSKFPMNVYWKERRFREILQTIKAVVVHSNRVRDHLASKSNNTDLLNKFILSRPCTYIMPKDIKPFNERNIDIIFYEKYPDSNRRKQGKKLFKLLNKTNKRIKKLKRGKYIRSEQLTLSNDSKFVVYFSFYDTGALALKEIQNYGVIAFSLQKDLVFSNQTSFYIPELEYDDMNPAFNKIMKIIDNVSKKNPDTKIIAEINQKYTNCERALDDLCEGLTKK